MMDSLLFAEIFGLRSQVYNEQIRDLLANAGPLAVREDSTKGVIVQGLTLHQVSRNMDHASQIVCTMLSHCAVRPPVLKRCSGYICYWVMLHLVLFFPEQPKSAEHILKALDSGNRNRTQHPTDMNATSSRSHAVLQVSPLSVKKQHQSQ